MGGETNLHNNWSYVKQMIEVSLKIPLIKYQLEEMLVTDCFKLLIRKKIARGNRKNPIIVKLPAI
jgi:hypothetical protein